MSGRGGITGIGDADDPDLRNLDLFHGTGLGVGRHGAFEHAGGKNESRHLHNLGDRDFVLRSFEPFDWEKTVIHLLEPIALVSYIVSAIVGSCFAIILSCAWMALDRVVTRIVIKSRTRRARAKTVVSVSGVEKTFV